MTGRLQYFLLAFGSILHGVIIVYLIDRKPHADLSAVGVGSAAFSPCSLYQRFCFKP